MTEIFKELGKAFVLGLFIFFVHALILYLAGNAWYGGSPFEFFWQNQVFSVALYMANWYAFKAYFDKPKTQKWTWDRVITGIVIATITSLVTVFILRLFLITGYYGRSFEEFIASETLSGYSLSLVISIVAIILYYGFYYWKYKQETKVKESKIIAGTASAQFDALKNQLDPHFLFNSLNVLTSLIEENPIQAQRFTTSLSKVYRYVLEQKSKELVTVDEELAFARTYMRLLKMRFEDSIIVDIPGHASNPEAKVVPLSLQLLLENAVKHNMVTPSKKLQIKIYERNGNLVVSNNIQPKNVIKKSSGVGLQNIRQRYYLLTNRSVEIQENPKEFAVAIPMLTKQIITPAAAQKTYIEDKKYERAKEKFEKIRDFYIHFTIYLIMVPVFIFLNYRSTGFPWAIFPIVGWGFGVASHAAETFGWNPFLGKDWEQRKIRKLMEDDEF